MKDSSIWIHSLPCCNIFVHSRSNPQIVLHTFQPLQLIPQYVEVKGHTKLLSSFISLQSFWWLCLFSLFRHRSLEWPSTWREIPASLPCGWAGPRRLTTKSSSRYWDGDKYGNVYSRIHFHEYLNGVLEILLSFFGRPKTFCWFTSSALSLI